MINVLVQCYCPSHAPQTLLFTRPRIVARHYFDLSWCIFKLNTGYDDRTGEAIPVRPRSIDDRRIFVSATFFPLEFIALSGAKIEYLPLRRTLQSLIAGNSPRARSAKVQ